MYQYLSKINVMEADTILKKHGRSSKSHTSRAKFSIVAYFIIFSALFISCGKDKDDVKVNDDVEPAIYVVDVSEVTEWDYAILGSDKSKLFFTVNEETDVPTRMFLMPDENSEDGFTFLFKANGLLDKMIFQNHIFYFGNFRGNKFDLAIIYPDNKIEYFTDIETDIDWDEYYGISIQRLFWDFSKASKTLKIIGHAAGVGTCVTTLFFPPAAIGCKAYATALVPTLTDVASIVVDKFVPDGIISDVAHVLLDVVGCAGGGWFGPIDCVSAMGNTIGLLSHLDLEFIDSKSRFINEAILNVEFTSDIRDIVSLDIFENLLELGIEINVGSNPPNVEGTFIITPLMLLESNFDDSLRPGYMFADMRLTFSNQNNVNQTVVVEYIYQDSATGSGLGSFIIGNGNKFSVFTEITGTFEGYPFKSVEIYSGEITLDGIRNYSSALMITAQSPATIRNGQGRLAIDADGFSPRVSSVPFEVKSVGNTELKSVIAK